MTNKFIAAAMAGASLLGPVAAQATMVDGSFSGTLSDGTDGTGVFGFTPGTDLTGDTVTGTFVYNTNLFTSAPSGSTDNYIGTGPGALTVTLTINGVSHTFTDSANSSLYLDSSGTSEVTYQSDASSVSGSTTVNDTFLLDVFDPFTPLVASTSLDQSFSTSNPYSSTGSFTINDGDPTLQATGDFTLGTLSQAPLTTGVPEPASVTLLLAGVAGISAGRARRRAKG